MDHILASTSNTLLSEVVSETCTTYTKLPCDAASCSWKFNLATDQLFFAAFCSLRNSISFFTLQFHSISYWRSELNLKPEFDSKLYTQQSSTTDSAVVHLHNWNPSYRGRGERFMVYAASQKGIKTIVPSFHSSESKVFYPETITVLTIWEGSDYPHCNTTPHLLLANGEPNSLTVTSNVR